MTEVETLLAILDRVENIKELVSSIHGLTFAIVSILVAVAITWFFLIKPIWKIMTYLK